MGMTGKIWILDTWIGWHFPKSIPVKREVSAIKFYNFTSQKGLQGYWAWSGYYEMLHFWNGLQVEFLATNVQMLGRLSNGWSNLKIHVTRFNISNIWARKSLHCRKHDVFGSNMQHAQTICAVLSLREAIVIYLYPCSGENCSLFCSLRVHWLTGIDSVEFVILWNIDTCYMASSAIIEVVIVLTY